MMHWTNKSNKTDSKNMFLNHVGYKFFLNGSILEVGDPAITSYDIT